MKINGKLCCLFLDDGVKGLCERRAKLVLPKENGEKGGKREGRICTAPRRNLGNCVRLCERPMNSPVMRKYSGIGKMIFPVII